MAVAKDQIRQIITENNITSVADVYALLKDSFKDILQELLEAEMDATLGYEKNCKGDLKSDNKRNGHSSKTLKSQYGEFQIDVPRDRNGEFEPKLIPKYQRDISGIEEKVISLYARGMSTRDIHDQLQELYGIELSAEMVSKITDKILPEVKEWQSRPLNPVYPFVFMDCIHYKVREDGRILSRAAYIVLGVTVEGYKEILSITVGANETSKFWLGMLNDLKNRGVQDVLFFCVDGLPGFKDAIQAVFPQAQIQRCVIHMAVFPQAQIQRCVIHISWLVTLIPCFLRLSLMVRRWQPYSWANSYVDFPALYLDIISKTSLFDKCFCCCFISVLIL